MLITIAIVVAVNITMILVMNAGETETQNTDNETEECLEIEIEYEWPAADYDRWAGGRSSSISYTPSSLDEVYKESEMIVEVVITE